MSMKNQIYEKKTFKQYAEKTIFKDKEQSFRIGKRFYKNQKEWKYRELKIKRKIEELFFKPISVFIDDMDKFEQKEKSEIQPSKNT